MALGLRRRQIPPWVALSDPDVRTYVRAVEAADGATLELPVRKALHEFITGCKADGIWSAIKASCILAGARTLTGALVPLAGAAPTNFNFVSGDYNRKTGLVGDGSTKYLDTNRTGSQGTQNSEHFCAFASAVTAATSKIFIGSGTGGVGASCLGVLSPATTSLVRSQHGNFASPGTISAGFIGVSRGSSAGYTFRSASTSASVTQVSQPPISTKFFVFAGNPTADWPGFHSDFRLAFYSIGESLDITLLDARVTTLINAFAAVIP